MKNLIMQFIVVGSLMIATASNAQKCKIMDKKDEFTGARIISTELVRLNKVKILSTSDWWYANMMFYKPNDNCYITFEFHTKGSGSSKIGDSFVKFDNDEVLKLEYPIVDAEREDAAGWRVRYTSFIITIEQLKLFSEKNIQKLRLTLPNQDQFPNIELEYNQKESDVIKNMAYCLLTHLQEVN